MPESTILGSVLAQKFINYLVKLIEKMFIKFSGLSNFDGIANIQVDRNKTQNNLT